MPAGAVDFSGGRLYIYLSKRHLRPGVGELPIQKVYWIAGRLCDSPAGACDGKQ